MSEQIIANNFSPEKLPKQFRLYISDFAMSHFSEMKKLQLGRILGPKSEGWRNVTDHNLMAGIMADVMAELLGLSTEDRKHVVHVALTHDWDKRMVKEAVRTGAPTEYNGVIRYQYDTDQMIALESIKSGIVRVTGNDWRDFERWDDLEKIMRYVDSSIGRGEFPVGWTNGVLNASGFVESETILDWRERVHRLGEDNPDINTKLGNELYDGVPLYNKLAEITGTIEREFHTRIVDLHPELQNAYPNSEDLSEIIWQTLYTRVAAVKN